MDSATINKKYLLGSDIAIDIKRFDSSPSSNALEKARARLFFIGFCFVLVFSIVIAKMFELSVYRQPVRLLQPLRTNPLEMSMKRSDIVDRNGVVIATSLPVVNFYAHPHLLKDYKAAAKSIASVLKEISVSELEKKLNPKRKFAYIKRNITPNEQFEINKLGIPGLSFEQTEYRVYPQGALFSHILGFVDVDNNGVSGLELSYNQELTEKKEPVILSLDMGVQEVVRTQLKDAVKTFGASGGIAAVMDVTNGELIAMVSYPDFDLNDYKDAPKENFFNKASLGVYEVGSVFKLFNTAMAIESGKVKVTDRFDATKPLVMASHRIKDFYPKNKWLDVEEILVHSSNIGSAKMALSVGATKQKEFLQSIGFFDELNLDLIEKATPLRPSVWRDVNVATVSYGYGVAVSSLHVLRATSAMVNGGKLFDIKMRPSSDILEYKQVVSEKTSKTLRKLMRKVVTDGSARNADVNGYLVGGKTGSAQMRENGKYISGKLRTSFIGAFPIDSPRYSIIVTLNDPKKIESTYGNTAGWNATPTAGKIIERIAPMLELQPNEEYKENVTRVIMEVGYKND